MRLMNKNTGAAKPATGKLAGGLLASGLFSDTGRAGAAQRSVSSTTHARRAGRPHPMETLNALTMRADLRQDIRDSSVFWLKIIAVCSATLAAFQITNNTLINVAHTSQDNKKETLK